MLTLVAGVAFAAGLTVASKNLTVLRTCVDQRDAGRSTAETDAYVNQNAANTNNGTGNFVDVQTGSGQNRRTYIRFDLTVSRAGDPRRRP